MTTQPREPLLSLNDADLSGKRFERFCLDLVRAQDDVVDAHLYGVHGDDQRGIDIHADLVDGRVRSIQCRRVKRFIKTDASKLIGNTTYVADEHRLWCTCAMSAGARDVFRATPRWDAWDIEQLSSAVRALPRERGRWLVEDHLGSAQRKRILGPDSELVLVPALRWFHQADEQPAALRTDQTLRGRTEVVGSVMDGIRSPTCRVVVLIGAGGIGKTRILREVANALLTERVIVLRDGVDVTAALAEELPRGSYTLIVDDAHRRRELPAILATIASSDDVPTVVLSTRPQRLDQLRADLLHAGVGLEAVRELTPLTTLSIEEATNLAREVLDTDHQHAAKALATITRDVPALCVLGARLINDGGLTPAELVNHEEARRDILARFRDELVGRVADDVNPGLVRRLLLLVAAFQPVDLSNVAVVEWLANSFGCDLDTASVAVRRVEAGALLGGTRRRRRVVPDVLGDHILREACLNADGVPTGLADQLVQRSPGWGVSTLLANLAELDWRLGVAGEPRVLDETRATLLATIVAAGAWDRVQLLERIESSATFMAEWVISVARELLDHPAERQTLLLDHHVDDDEARAALAPLLRNAAFSQEHTESAMYLLWELGRDRPPRSGLRGDGPLELLARFADYQLHSHYSDTLMSVIETLVADESEAELRRALPIDLVRPLTAREGTTATSVGWAVSMGSYLVDAEGARPLRDRLRALLVDRCVHGGPRCRAAAAAILGGMLRQPHGYYGRSVSREAIAQWRPEQLALVDEIDGVMDRSDDIVVVSQLRDDLQWHADHSAIRGVKTRARRVIRRHPLTTDELVLRALTSRLAFAERFEVARQRLAAVARTLSQDAPSVADLLARIDRIIVGLRDSDSDAYIDPGQLLAALAKRDVTWAMEAADLLAKTPTRPTAAALGVVLTVAVEKAPDEVRSLLAPLAEAKDPMLRRLAADHVSRMGWRSDPTALERDIAVRLASDDDPATVRLCVLTAHRAADDDAALAKAIVLAISSVVDMGVAEDVCMVLSHDLGLEDADVTHLLAQLVDSADIGHWHDRFLLELSSRDPRMVLAYFLRRIAKPYQNGYRAVPFDGLSGDPLGEHTSMRAELLLAILEFAAVKQDAIVNHECATLFWSYNYFSPVALDVLGAGFASSSKSNLAAASDFLDQAPHALVLGNPDWVSRLLESARSQTLDIVRGSLSAALTCGMRQGTPGQPFARDVELRDNADKHASAARPGSRTAAFWKTMANSARAAIVVSLAEDRDLDSE